jgi:hypothetical protein
VARADTAEELLAAVLTVKEAAGMEVVEKVVAEREVKKETAVEEDASRTRGTNPHESYPQACCPERP